MHNKEEDLWLVIKLEGEDYRKVFNVTEYVMEHPGKIIIHSTININNYYFTTIV